MQSSRAWAPGVGRVTHTVVFRGKGQLRGMAKRFKWLLLI
jgi:hypothetical protein